MIILTVLRSKSKVGMFALAFAMIHSGIASSQSLPFTLLHSFSASGTDAAYPDAELISDGKGNLYGTTSQGGTGTGCANGCGTVFTMKTDGSGFQILHSFSASPGDGSQPGGRLILDCDGNLYGTTTWGGESDNCNKGCGTIYTLFTTGTGYRLLHSFEFVDGEYPWAGLVPDGQGNLFGTAQYGGHGVFECGGGCGTVFKLSTDGEDFSVIHDFINEASDGDAPVAPLIFDGSGNLYGTAIFGGANNAGTVYTLRPDGTGFKVLHTFDFTATDGNVPHGGLVLDSEDYLYGVTRFGGAHSGCGDLCGTVYKIKSDGTEFRILHSFSGAPADGQDGSATLVFDGRGNLVGGTALGGASNEGTVFKIASDGTDYLLLHSFSAALTDGESGDLGVFLDPSGDLIGATPYGGENGVGTIFRLTVPVASGSVSGPEFSGVCSGESDRLTLTVDGETASLPTPISIDWGDGSPLDAETVSSVPAVFQHDVVPTNGGGTDVVTNYVVKLSDFYGPVPVTGGPLSVRVHPTPIAIVGAGSSICGGQSPHQLSGSGGSGCSWSPTSGLDDAESCTPIANPSVTTTYTLTVADSNGCQSTNAPNVLIVANEQPPAISIVSGGPTTFCSGSSVMLSGPTGFAAYLWDRNGVPIGSATSQTYLASTTGDYSVTVTDSGSCQATSSVLSVVAEEPAPEIAGVTGCLPGSSTSSLSASGDQSDTFTWTISGASIVSGQGTNTLRIITPPAGSIANVSVVETTPLGCASVPATSVIASAFADIGASEFGSFICDIEKAGITVGCGNGDYCPSETVTRDTMAVFLLRAEHGSSYTPPACVSPDFNDVPCSNIYSAWINELAAEGITLGCGSNDYCPLGTVTRDTMAVFILRTEHGGSYMPPGCGNPFFADVPCSNIYAPWIDQLWSDEIVSGCGNGDYCPTDNVTREEMAKFLDLALINIP